MRGRLRSRSMWCGLICALAIGLGAAPADASRSLVKSSAIDPAGVPGGGQVEGACGAAVVGSALYVSEYYRQRIDLFSLSNGSYLKQISAPSSLDGVCGLAFGGGALYANEWHEGVVRLVPSVQYFDTEHESTGVALDASGNVYALNRTYVAVYQPSGDPVLSEGEPLEIGHGSLGDAYGIAVFGSRVYVADAATEEVKVFEPAVDPAAPVATIDHDFVSLRDGALAVDPENGHLLVLDNLQPGYEEPQAAIEEFGADGSYLGRLEAPEGIVHGGPSGLAFDGVGNLYVTSGNSAGSEVLKFGPYVGGGFAAESSFDPRTFSAAAGGTEAAAAESSSESGTRASASEVVQRGGVRVSVQADLAPKRLPRSGRAPVSFSLATGIVSTDGEVPPQLRRLEVAINRNGQLNPAALPACSVDQIQPSTTQGALAACRSSLVGKGSFSAKVLLTQQTPFPSDGEVVAFNGRWHGKPAILAHIYGNKPIPTSYTLPFVIASAGKGTYGTVLKASLPQFTSKWGFVTGISLDIKRSSAHGGYLTAGCPAPKKSNIANFSLARARLSFGPGTKPVVQTLVRSCRVR
jgi:hypothetical protein